MRKRRRTGRMDQINSRKYFHKSIFGTYQNQIAKNEKSTKKFHEKWFPTLDARKQNVGN